ncbi:helix-turn-helix domain-containing protein [Actinomadura sp. WMMA1423]|uniref:helix-turn-helix domain-containing protein n=1 Tax=Actinomadura sp. WMMA1423 TaxID=2591108 RepID=UPI00114644B4|nr:helix-turn-helix domain-containing protein [Actinomadura sp. WMMA1423]
MHGLRQWAGLSLSEVEERMRADGAADPSGIEALRGAGAPPGRELVAAFVTACGLAPDERERWLRAYDRVRGPAEGDDPWTAELPAMELNLAAAAPPPRPGRHGTSRSGPGGRRRLSLLVAAPVVITLGVVVSTLPGVFGGGAEPHPRPGASGEPAPPPAGGAVPSPPGESVPPLPGWYTVMPLPGEERSGNCLSIMPDDRLKPQLAQDRCVAQDRLQRIRLAPVPASSGTFQLKAYTMDDALWCVTLDARAERSPLHMNRCGKDPRQRFVLTPAGRSLFRIVPEATRGDGMCVSVDTGESGELEAVQAACGRTAVRGYLFAPAAAP